MSENLPNAYFAVDYVSARNRFRAAVSAAGGALDALPIDARGPSGEALTIDVAWFGARLPDRVLLHSSGTHGVEAFAGSAIQLQALERLPAVPEGAAIVLVHALNPYGMAWLRRVNEANVDLNRNFLAPDEQYRGSPAAYAHLDPLLNPASPPSRDLFLARAVLKIARYGMSALRQAVAGGQYDYPKGLFFGGATLQQGPRLYAEFLASRLASAERVVAVDVHTGLGKRGEDTLLVEADRNADLRGVFGDRVTALDAGRGPAYRVRGGLQSMLPRAMPGAQVHFVGQEFGTEGPLTVLRVLREENRWHHYGAGRLDDPAKRRMRKAFCPDDERWRRAVLARGQELFDRALALALA